MRAAKLPIVGPCPIDLDKTDFDREARQNFCGHCQKNVYVISNMTRDEARGFLKRRAGENVCLSYRRDTEGRIAFKPAAAAAAVGLVASLAACTPHDRPELRPRLGDVSLQAKEVELDMPAGGVSVPIQEEWLDGDVAIDPAELEEPCDPKAKAKPSRRR